MAINKPRRAGKVQDDQIKTGTVTAGPIEIMSGDSIEAQPDETAAEKAGWVPKGEELKVWAQFRRRKSALLQSRYNVYGLNIDAEMRRMDKKYFRRQADIPSSELDANQRPLAINNAYSKIQTAISILIDGDPTYIMESDAPQYDKTKNFLKALAEKSWRNTNSKGQLKLSIFNAARRGWFIGRTYNKRLFHDARFLKDVDTKGRRHYETRLVTKMDDIAYINLSNYNAWLDEQTKPEDFFSTRDWMWREVMYIDDLKRMFPKSEFPNMIHVRAGGDTRENIQGIFSRNSANNKTGISPMASKRGMTEVYFYENQYSDQFIIEANGVMICAEPLPQNNKRLSCTYGTWHLRGDDTVYGLGIIEEMENDEELVDRILNMTMRQLLLTIAPMGFYSGTEDMEDENMKITPGVMRRTMNPKDINWLEIPQGNQAGMDAITFLKQQQEEKTGISDTLMGNTSGAGGGKSPETAFQVGVDREAGLKRLALPLQSIQYALKNEFDNRIALIQQTYSDFEVQHLAAQEDINDYLDSVKANPEMFHITDEGTPKEKFYAVKYRQANINVEKTEDGSFIEAETSKFFSIKPEMLAFSGFTSVDMSSLLTSSKALDQADTLRMANLLAPLLQGPPEINAKIAKQMLQAFDKEPNKWLPQAWLDFLAGKKEPPVAANATAAPGSAPAGGAPIPSAQTVVPNTETGGQGVSVGQ